MTRLQHEVSINASPSQVWQALADFGNISVYNPGIPKSYLTSAQSVGIGATRHCDLSQPGMALEERIIDWKEGEAYTIEVHGGEKLPPVEHMQVTLAVRSEANGSIASTVIVYQPKYGVIGFLMDMMMMRKGMAGGMQGLLAGLKHYCETGERVESNQQIDLDVVVAA